MRIFLCTFLFFFLVSCSSQHPVVDPVLADSLMKNYLPSEQVRMNSSELEFWRSRIDIKNPGFTNEIRYAAALAGRFFLLGDIHDINSSDSVLKIIDSVYNHKEAGPITALAIHGITQHHFREADSLLLAANRIGLKRYDSCALSFDVNFELGRYNLASNQLYAIRANNDYGYLFRLSKLLHYYGDIDSSINVMICAAQAAGNSVPLKVAALSNAGDLFLHEGKAGKAFERYRSSLKLSSSDWHSLIAIGWIALVHDHNDTLAERIFQFVKSKTHLPDPLLRLEQVEEFRHDAATQKKYAQEFVEEVSDSLYGGMYNKYLVGLYTGILNDPAKAVMIAKKEITNRATPQTYAWLVYSLFANHELSEAESYFTKYVSGKPLEALELFWMGKLMKGMNKGYNAQQFFKAAEKNRYDLSPAQSEELEKLLE